MFQKNTATVTQKPTLLRQLSFYVHRLRKEKVTKVVAASVASLALVLQLTAGVFPLSGDTAQAAGNDNIVRNGVNSKAEMLAVYDRNSDGAGHNDIKAIYTHFGVTRQDIANSTMGSYKSNDFNGQLKTIGRTNWANTGRTAVKVNSTTTVYTGPFLNGDNNRPIVQKALIGKRAVDGKWFAITLDCGNIVYVDMPQKPKPTPKPAAVCTSLSINSITRTSFKLNARAAKSDGATISAYRYVITKNGAEVLDRNVATTGTSSSINYTAEAAGDYVARVTVQTSVGAKTSDDCVKRFTVKPIVVNVGVEKIEVCDLDTMEPITINKDDYDSSIHSKDMEDCVRDEDVCVPGEEDRITGDNNSVDDSGDTPDDSDGRVDRDNSGTGSVDDNCDETPVVNTEDCPVPGKENLSANSPDCEEDIVVTPAPTQELPKTGLGEDVMKVAGLGSIIASIGYYVASRRGLLTAMLER